MFKIIFSFAMQAAAGEYFPRKRGESMPYPVGHRSEVRRKIVESARRLFNRHGFDNISVDQLCPARG
jgi:AcrR family transcriptional regulator